MISLVYFSSAGPDFTRDDLGAVLESSRRNNAAAGVTGLLCHFDGSFLQFLEGDPADVSRTFDRIALDHRHRSILKVHEAPIEKRAFDAWSMGLVEADRASVGSSAFAHSLRQVEIGADAEQREVLSGFLDAFRAWMR